MTDNFLLALLAAIHQHYTGKFIQVIYYFDFIWIKATYRVKLFCYLFKLGFKNSEKTKKLSLVTIKKKLL